MPNVDTLYKSIVIQTLNMILTYDSNISNKCVGWQWYIIYQKGNHQQNDFDISFYLEYVCNIFLNNGTWIVVA